MSEYLNKGRVCLLQVSRSITFSFSNSSDYGQQSSGHREICTQKTMYSHQQGGFCNKNGEKRNIPRCSLNRLQSGKDLQGMASPCKPRLVLSPLHHSVFCFSSFMASSVRWVIQLFQSRWRNLWARLAPPPQKKTKTKSPLDHFRIQKSKTLWMLWSVKIEILLEETKEVGNASLFLCTCIALTERNDSSKWCIHFFCLWTSICPHKCIYSRTLTSFTQNSCMTHSWRGGILALFWFLSF